MQGQGFYDQNGCLVFPDEMGAFTGNRRGVERMAGPPGTRIPITRTRIPLRKIGGASPGWWEDLKVQLKKVPTPLYIVGGFGLILALVLAKGEKGTWLQKI